MKKTNIRKEALSWFANAYPTNGKIKVYASKFYAPSESWSKTSVWFFQIPERIVSQKTMEHIFLLCENNLLGEKFIVVKLPISFIQKHQQKFETNRKMQKVMLYLSAEIRDKFKEVRKGSKS